MRVLFWGTPAYAVPSLDALVAAGHSIVGVVSQPDRRRGRGKALVPSPVKARALELALPVFTPARIRREPELQAELAALGADLSVVVAFGQILPPEVLAQPPLGCWNGHGSLLPRWRGAAPIQWALLEGDASTGVGIMAMEAGLDTGPVLLERSLPIGLLETAGQLGERLSRLTAELLVEALPLIEAAGPGPEAERLQRLGVRPQSPDGMTYARQLVKEDYRLDWSQSALALHRRVMALHPGAYTTWRGKRLQILASEPLVRRLSDQLSPEAARLAQQLVQQWGLESPAAQLSAVQPPVAQQPAAQPSAGQPPVAQPSAGQPSAALSAAEQVPGIQPLAAPEAAPTPSNAKGDATPSVLGRDATTADLSCDVTPPAAKQELRNPAAMPDATPSGPAAPGTVLAVEPGIGLVVASGGCPLLVRQARLEGKAAVSGAAWIQQWGGRLGDRFGEEEFALPSPAAR